MKAEIRRLRLQVQRRNEALQALLDMLTDFGADFDGFYAVRRAEFLIARPIAGTRRPRDWREERAQAVGS